MRTTRRLSALGVLALSAALLSSGSVAATAATTGGGTVTGYVLTGGGTALEGATVSARPQDGGRTYTTATASTGQFGATLPAGRYVVMVSAAGYSTKTVGHPVVLSTGKVVSLTVHLRRPGTLTGRVVEKDGDPVKHASVAVTGPVKVTLHTTAAGTYATTLPAGRYTVAVTKGGFALRPSTTVHISPTATVSAGTTTLRDEAVLSGYVRDANGAALASVTVRLTRLGGTSAAGVPIRSTATTSDLGHYRVDGLRTGRYRVAVVLSAAQSSVYATPPSVVVRLSYGKHSRQPLVLVAASPSPSATPSATPAAG